MPGQRTIAVVTGSRADFGLLRSIMTAIRSNRRLRLRTIVAGAHLASGTWRDVIDAGFSIDRRLPMQRRGRTGRSADVEALGRGVRGAGEAFADLQPHVVLVLGDRIEAFAVACAAQVGGLHLAHVHGGDRAEGVADESMRHAVSKLAHLHFAATSQSCRRLVRMGESRQYVHLVGSPAVDGIENVVVDDDAPCFVVAQHPIDGSNAQERLWMKQTLTAVTAVLRDCGSDRWVLVAEPNVDPGSDGIRSAIRSHVDRPARKGRGSRFRCAHHPRDRFLSYLAGSRAIVGNSSAGLIEAAALRIPCVNVGPRQRGRQKPAHVIDCNYGLRTVQAAIRKAISTRARRHPYGDGNSGRRIADLLARVDLGKLSLRKRNTY